MRRLSLSLHNRTSKLWMGWVEGTIANRGKRFLVSAPTRIEALASGWISWRFSVIRPHELRLVVARPNERTDTVQGPVAGELLLDFPAGHTEAIVFLEEPRPEQVLLRAIYVW